MITNSSLKAKLIQSLEEGSDHVALLELVRSFKSTGGGQREAYDTLEDIWKEYGYDDHEGDVVDWRKDELEYVMEVVWGFCAYKPPI